MGFDLGFLAGALPDLLNGVITTLEVSVLGIVLGLVIGIIGAAVITLKVPALRWIITAYVEIFRNTPLLGQIYFLYFGLPSLGIVYSEFITGVIALALWCGAFATDNFSGGFNAVPKQLQEAGTALGMTRLQVYRHIVIPVGFRISFPSFGNTAISVIKCSSYLAGIGLMELTKTAMGYVSTYFKTNEMFSSLAVLYLGIVCIFTFLFTYIERRMNHKKAS